MATITLTGLQRASRAMAHADQYDNVAADLEREAEQVGPSPYARLLKDRARTLRQDASRFRDYAEEYSAEGDREFDVHI